MNNKDRKFIKRWEKVRGTFPTKEENDFIEALWVYSFGDTINIPYIYDTTKSHRLIREKEDLENKYRLVPAEDWMPFQFTYNKEESEILSVDTDGLGSAIYCGMIIEGKKVIDIKWIENKGVYIYFE